MIELNSLNKSQISALFHSADVAEAERLVAEEISEKLLQEQAHSDLLERIQSGVVRLSGGRLDHLREAISLAYTGEIS